MYYLLGMKQSAWLTTTGQYNTDRKQAQVFDRETAFARAARHKEASNILIPVRVEDMEAL